MDMRHKIMANKVKAKFPLKAASIRKKTEATIDAIETILVNAKIITHTNTTNPSILGQITARAPALVAIPLPPLKFKKGVQLCPEITEAAAKIL